MTRPHRRDGRRPRELFGLADQTCFAPHVCTTLFYFAAMAQASLSLPPATEYHGGQ
jgi:hypothetical protein